MSRIEDKVNIADEVLFHELDGEAVLLNLQSGKYFGLDAVGTRMWTLLVEQGNLAAAYRTLLEEYDVDGDRLLADLLELVDRMAMHGLVWIDQT